MSTLSTVRHTVRRGAARTRRSVLWTPGRYRAALTAAVAVLVLVPVVSLAVRSPWNDVVPAGAGAAVGPIGGALDNGLGNGLDNGLGGGAVDVGAVGEDAGAAPVPSAGATPGTVPSPSAPVAVDAAPLAVADVLAQAGRDAASAPARDPAASTGQPTLSPDGVTDVWKAQARESAVRFAQAWLAGATAASSQAWLGTLRPYLDPEAEKLVALTNLAAIPRTTARTVQLLTLTEAESTAVVALASGGRLDVALGWDGESWRVTSYEPVAAPGVAAPAVSPSAAAPSPAPSAAASSAAPSPQPSGTPAAP